MEIFDISWEIYEGMAAYNKLEVKQPSIKAVMTHNEGSVHETQLSMNLHTGTHVDMPLHMIKEGADSESFDFKKLIGPCRVIDLTSVKDSITSADLKECGIKENEFLIFKTSNSFSEEFLFDFVFLSEDGAKYLADKKISGVGIDALGIERSQPGHFTHKILMNSGVVILEGLRLDGIEEGEYTLMALPLKIRKVEALPVRAILIKD